MPCVSAKDLELNVQVELNVFRFGGRNGRGGISGYCTNSDAEVLLHQISCIQNGGNIGLSRNILRGKDNGIITLPAAEDNDVGQLFEEACFRNMSCVHIQAFTTRVAKFSRSVVCLPRSKWLTVHVSKTTIIWWKVLQVATVTSFQRELTWPSCNEALHILGCAWIDAIKPGYR